MRAAALAASLQNECDGRVWLSSKQNSNVLDLCKPTQSSESTFLLCSYESAGAYRPALHIKAINVNQGVTNSNFGSLSGRASGKHLMYNQAFVQALQHDSDVSRACPLG